MKINPIIAKLIISAQAKKYLQIARNCCALSIVSKDFRKTVRQHLFLPASGLCVKLKATLPLDIIENNREYIHIKFEQRLKGGTHWDYRAAVKYAQEVDETAIEATLPTLSKVS